MTVRWLPFPARSLALCFAAALFGPLLNAPQTAWADEALPSPWNGMDIGRPTPAGTAAANNGTFMLTGGGDLSAHGDALHFVYQSLTGDCTLTARVAAPGGTPGENGGLMARQALAATSDFVAVALTPNHVVLSSFRTPCTTLSTDEGSAAAAETWIRLRKIGEIARTYWASDQDGSPGVWKQIGSGQPIPTGMIYVGLWEAGQTSGSKAVFDHVTLDTGPQPLFDNGSYIIGPADAPGMLLQANGNAVQLASATGAADQTWRLVTDPGGVYSLQPQSDPTRALTVPGGTSKPGTLVAVLPDSGQNTQRWAIVTGSDGAYRLLPQFNSGMSLDDFGGNSTPGAVIDIWNDNSADPHLQWIINPIP